VACHHEEVPSEMPEVLAARAAYKAAERQAIEIRRHARLRLGRAALEERKALDKTQQDVAKELGVGVEQVRRWETEWREWQRDHPGEEP
jgi:DNA-binding transcriptional regulator YiaG